MLEDKKEEPKKEEVEQPTDQNAPVDEKKDNPEVEDQQPEGEEEVTISKKELETLKKKSLDFEKSIELKRLKKLGEKEITKTPEDNNELLEKFNQLEEEVRSFKEESFNSKLSTAYREFVKGNPWANEDNTFDKIKENFNSVGTESKEELLSKFKNAAQTAFPVEYQKHLEDKIKSDVMSKKIPENSGGGASSVDTIHKDNKPKTKEDAMAEKMASLYEKAQPGR